MSKFYLYLEQASDGCDYSIGCGKVLGSLRAQTREEAVKEVIGLPDDWKDNLNTEDDIHDYICETGLRYLDQDERRLSECTILEVVGSIDMFPLLQAKQKQVDELRNKFRQDEKDKADLAEYERLKKKFKTK